MTASLPATLHGKSGSGCLRDAQPVPVGDDSIPSPARRAYLHVAQHTREVSGQPPRQEHLYRACDASPSKHHCTELFSSTGERHVFVSLAVSCRCFFVFSAMKTLFSPVASEANPPLKQMQSISGRSRARVPSLDTFGVACDSAVGLLCAQMRSQQPLLDDAVCFCSHPLTSASKRCGFAGFQPGDPPYRSPFPNSRR